jgi:hypothetical protein
MIKQTLLLSILPAALAVQADCITDAPEIGDVGPSSELVCAELQRRFPGAELAVEGRTIHAADAVSVQALRDGTPLTLRYTLAGYVWQSDGAGAEIADIPALR